MATGQIDAQATARTQSRRPVNTFVVRRWLAEGTEAQYTIDHVQSGRHTVVADPSNVTAWIGGFGAGESQAMAQPVAS